MKEYLATSKSVLNELGTDEESGLSAHQAQQELEKFGPNKLDEEKKTPLWIRFFEQMLDPMVIMLIVAAIISAVTGMIFVLYVMIFMSEKDMPDNKSGHHRRQHICTCLCRQHSCISKYFGQNNNRHGINYALSADRQHKCSRRISHRLADTG